MNIKHPHWYHEKMEPCCNMEVQEEECCVEAPQKVHAFPDAKFKDRLLCLIGDEIMFSVDARICGRDSFCGILCYVGCDFIIVNMVSHRKPLSMHIPINMIRYIAPFQGGRRR